MNNELREKIDKIKEISLKDIIISFGGTFLSSTKFSHGYFNEKTPSCYIYRCSGEEKWKCFGRNIGGDALDFVSIITGENKIEKVVDSILGNKYDFNKSITNGLKDINSKEVEEKNKKKIYVIKRNSTDFRRNFLAKKYFLNRNILEAAEMLNDPSISILYNEYSHKDKDLKSIVYSFTGRKGDFLIMKGIDDKGNKTGRKINVGSCRPVLHNVDNAKPILVTEGIEDSLSGQMMGYMNFISLNSTSMLNFLMNNINNHKKWYQNHELELLLDNDKAGNEATLNLKIFSNISGFLNKDCKKDLIEIIDEEYKKKKDKSDEKNDDYIYKYLRKMINEYDKSSDKNSCNLLQIVKNSAKIIDEKCFNDFGDYYNIKESDIKEKMIKSNVKDLNEFIINKELKSKEIINKKNELTI